MKSDPETEEAVYKKISRPRKVLPSSIRKKNHNFLPTDNLLESNVMPTKKLWSEQKILPHFNYQVDSTDFNFNNQVALDYFNFNNQDISTDLYKIDNDKETNIHERSESDEFKTPPKPKRTLLKSKSTGKSPHSFRNKFRISIDGSPMYCRPISRFRQVKEINTLLVSS
jgi:hypothetical protein